MVLRRRATTTRTTNTAQRTIASCVHIKHIAHLDVDGPEEALILFLELFLVKDLNCENTLVGDGPNKMAQWH